ncbi:MAG TPA: hypothetical protein VGX91_10075, partial [Candidatus Cybelea sp.]|nr:hypothetical protein [Candidatus Cybelea sp.]
QWRLSVHVYVHRSRVSQTRPRTPVAATRMWRRRHTQRKVPELVLHSFTSERRETLRVKPGVPFYEEGTYCSRSIEAVASGKLL